MSGKKYTIKPVEKLPPRRARREPLYDELVSDFLELGEKYAEVSVEGKKSATVLSALRKRVKGKGILVRSMGGKVYLELVKRRTSRKIDPEESYQFVMSFSPNLLRGVSLAKWTAFLNILEARNVQFGKTASHEVLREASRELQLSADQVSNINCTKKCLEIYNHDGPAFRKCVEYCRRTGDP